MDYQNQKFESLLSRTQDTEMVKILSMLVVEEDQKKYNPILKEILVRAARFVLKEFLKEGQDILANTTSGDMSQDKDNLEEEENNLELEAEKMENGKQNNDADFVKIEKVCRYYKAGKCKHGFSGKTGGECKFLHPTMCKKFRNHGNRENGCKDSKCKNVHVQICPNSYRTGKCSNSDCKYNFHLRPLSEKQSKQDRKGSNSQFQQAGKITNVTNQAVSVPQVANVASGQPAATVQTPAAVPFLGITKLEEQINQIQAQINTLSAMTFQLMGKTMNNK